MKIESAHDVFWLARYAHNTLDPLIKAVHQYEPSATLAIEMVFNRERSWSPLGMEVNIISHWSRNLMFLHDLGLTTKEGVDAVAAKVQQFIDAEQAALEAAHDAAVLADMEQADAEAAQDWEFQMERAAERADIERDEDAHDIELQNEMAGN